MIKPVVITTRTQPGADALCARLCAHGYDAHALPLLRAVPTHAPLPCPPAEISGCIATSGHALAYLGTFDHTLPMVTVGDGTAAQARAHGWASVRAGGGDVATLAAYIRGQNLAGTWVYPCAAEPAAGSLATLADTGCDIRPWPVYRTEADTAFWDDFSAYTHTKSPLFVLLHSPKGARIFAEGVQGRIPPETLGKMTLLCLSGAVLESVADVPCAGAYTAQTPDEDALVELLGRP